MMEEKQVNTPQKMDEEVSIQLSQIFKDLDKGNTSSLQWTFDIS